VEPSHQSGIRSSFDCISLRIRVQLPHRQLRHCVVVSFQDAALLMYYPSLTNVHGQLFSAVDMK